MTIRGYQTGVDGQVRAGRFRWGLARTGLLWWVTYAFDRFVDLSEKQPVSSIAAATLFDSTGSVSDRAQAGMLDGKDVDYSSA